MNNKFTENVRAVLSDIETLLIEKNSAYGNSALEPVRCFSKSSADEQLRVRIDDKISRIQKGDGSGDEDAVFDLIGYLVLLKINDKPNEYPYIPIELKVGDIVEYKHGDETHLVKALTGIGDITNPVKLEGFGYVDLKDIHVPKASRLRLAPGTEVSVEIKYGSPQLTIVIAYPRFMNGTWQIELEGYGWRLVDDVKILNKENISPDDLPIKLMPGTEILFMRNGINYQGVTECYPYPHRKEWKVNIKGVGPIALEKVTVQTGEKIDENTD